MTAPLPTEPGLYRFTVTRDGETWTGIGLSHPGGQYWCTPVRVGGADTHPSLYVSDVVPVQVGDYVIREADLPPIEVGGESYRVPGLIVVGPATDLSPDHLRRVGAAYEAIARHIERRQAEPKPDAAQVETLAAALEDTGTDGGYDDQARELWRRGVRVEKGDRP